MNRRNFCKTTAATLIMWGLNPLLAFANYALRHPKNFDEEMEAVGCVVENSHCKLKI